MGNALDIHKEIERLKRIVKMLDKEITKHTNELSSAERRKDIYLAKIKYLEKEFENEAVNV